MFLRLHLSNGAANRVPDTRGIGSGLGTGGETEAQGPLASVSSYFRAHKDSERSQAVLSHRRRAPPFS